MSNEVWTPLKLVEWTAKHFAGKEIPQPRLEAELLLAHVLDWQRIDLYTRFEHVLAQNDLARFRELVKRRAQRVPRQYLTRSDEFYGLKLTLDERVLIPRNETEHLVEQALALLDESQHANVVELCTGSAAVAVALAANRQSLQIHACDISQDALDVARINIDAFGLGQRIALHQGDLFEALPETLKGTLDLILANPPYVRDDEWDHLPPEVVHEPRSALLAGPTGLEIIERIIQQAPDWLKPNGHLLAEIGFGQARAVSELASSTQDYGSPTLVRDLGKIQRIIVLNREDSHG